MYLRMRLCMKSLLLALYLSLICGEYMYVNVSVGKKNLGILMLFLFSIFYIFSQMVLNYLAKQREIQTSILLPKKKLLLFSVASLITFTFSIIWFIAYYPGSFSVDSIDQYHQVITGHYSDWHPVWHTVLFFWIPLKLTGQVSSIVFFQIVYFSLFIGYLVLTLWEIAGKKWSLLSFLWILLNPYIYHVLLYPWKDVAFALGSGLLLLIAVHMILFKKNLSLWQLGILGLLMASTTLFRHNGILYTLPLICSLFFHMKRRDWKILLLFGLLSFSLIKFPLYHTLEVEEPNRRVVESMGLTLTVLGNVVKETPERLDEELSEVAYAIAPHDKWMKRYTQGNFNAIKWTGIDTTIVEEKGYLGMTKVLVTCFRKSPGASFRAMFALTDIVYGFETGLKGNVNAQIAKNLDGIGYPTKPAEGLRKTLDVYTIFINQTFFKYFRTYGLIILMMLICALSNLNIRSRESLKKELIILPIFIHNFGTMFLLTGPDSRFFFITYLVAPIILGYSFHCKGETIDG